VLKARPGVNGQGLVQTQIEKQRFGIKRVTCADVWAKTMEMNIGLPVQV